MKKSPRPKARPAGLGKKPMANPARKKPMPNPMNDPMSKRSIEQRTLRPMAKGGMCRGMGAAKKGGGSLSKNG